MTEQDSADYDDFRGFCRGATDRQLENILRKEWEAKRLLDYHAAKAEAERRGWFVQSGERV